MFQPWRLKLREVEAAIASGRLDEAGALLGQGELQDYWPARKLTARLAERAAQRGRERVQLGETAAGWVDLEVAGRWGADLDQVAVLRRELLDKTLADAESYLLAGHTEMALARLDELHRRHAVTQAVRSLGAVARHVQSAQRHARGGQFFQAADDMAAAAALRPDLAPLAERCQRYRLNAEEVAQLNQYLHDRLAEADWNEVLATVERLLSLAPAHQAARDARRRAWEAVGARWIDSTPGTLGRATREEPRNQSVSHKKPKADAVRRDGRRFLLWVDAVGGYLVCTGDEVTLGQPVPGRAIDVPILADLSSVHARIRRGGEGYLLEAVRDTQLDGRPVTGTVPLVDGQTIELGRGVLLRFVQPHALSSSARLEFVSRHRTQPSADAVLLMAESLVLGAKTNSHVVCRDWSEEVVIHRSGETLYCCTPGAFEVDGEPQQDRAALRSTSHASGEEFSLSLESLP